TGWIAMIRSYLHRPNSRSLTRCFLHTFSFAGFIVLLLLIAARVLLEPTERWFEEYLNGPHHLVPELMIFIPSLTAFALPWAQRRRLGRATFIALFGIAML